MAGDALEVLTYKDSFHACHVLDTLRSLYKERKLCDVTLVVENETIWAHRLILAANSSYFFSMFTSGMCETSQELIALKELDFEAVNALVEYCYTSTIVITEKNVQNILSAANLLQFMTVVETCCGFLKNQLHPSNCLGIGNFADHHGCAKLREAAQEYAEKNFLDVYKTDEFLLATLNQIQAMLTSDFLNVISEKEVFDSCIRWVRHDLDNRRAHLSELMRYIRLPLLPPKILVDCIESEELVEENDSCMRLISEAKTFHLLPDRRNKTEKFVSKPRQKDSGKFMYLVGGEVHNNVFNTVQRFDFESKEWQPVTPLHKCRDGVGVATYSGHIYAAGGCDGDVALSSVERYNPADKQWTYVQPMACGRHAFGLVELDGWLFAAGGSDFSKTEYSSVERYDPVRDSWDQVKPMTATREGLAMVTLDGSLFAMGGDNGMSILNTVERYDPRLDRWSACISMSYRRRYFSAAILKGKIYAVGGSDYDQDHNSVECYDPRMNKWISLPPLLSRRESPAAAVVDEKLLALGGANNNVETDAVDCYDPLANKWEPFAALPRATEGMGVAVL